MKRKSLRTTTADLIKMFIADNQYSLGTSVPGRVVAFDAVHQLASLVVGIRTIDGLELPPIVQCPVQFAGGGGFSFEHQINDGDEGIIIFSQRCIDAWVETGGPAEQPVARLHDFTDAYFVPGIRSKPNAIKNFVNDGIRLRNAEGDQFIHLQSDGNILIQASAVVVEGNITVNSGSSITAETVIATSSLVGGAVEMVGHLHTGVQSGGDNSGPPFVPPGEDSDDS